jgi:hypothetical protein
MIRCTANRRGGSSTAVTIATAICRSTCSAPPSFGQQAAACERDAADGAAEEVARVVAHIRAQWPATRIALRADSGFAREELMAWCEANGVDFVLGLAQNERLNGEIENELDQVAAKSVRTGRPERRFKSFMWRTLDSWSCRRRVIARVEWTEGEANPRFVVTSLRRDQCKSSVKECQLDLYADRTSSATMRANQLRLWFASMAHVLLCALRRIERRLRHHPAQAAQDRRPRAHQCQPHQDRHGERREADGGDTPDLGGRTGRRARLSGLTRATAAASPLAHRDHSPLPPQLKKSPDRSRLPDATTVHATAKFDRHSPNIPELCEDLM